MKTETQLRHDICAISKSFFDRGFTHGSSGNISAKLEDGGFLVTPTGSSFGDLDPARLSRLDAEGRHMDGDPPTKEVPLHTAFYDTRPTVGAVVHLHAIHSVAWSMQSGLDPRDAMPALTPYAVMLLGQVQLLPVFIPGSNAISDAIRALPAHHWTILLAHHGPVVAGRDLAHASNVMEELEFTARLAVMTENLGSRPLTADMVSAIKDHFGPPPR